jgi:hypothetical protein
MEFVKLNGYLNSNSAFISIEIKNGDNKNSIGDQVWINNDGTEMEVYAHADSDALEEIHNKFTANSKLAFRGALKRMGISF